MNLLETIGTRVRHLPGIRRFDAFWRLVRPFYDRLILRSAAGQGLSRRMNGMDDILILPEFRALPEAYEPEVWTFLLPEVREGDRIVDIGAHYGLYAMAFARRVGPKGHVLAVEADPANAEVLRRHVILNNVQDRVEVVPMALADQDGVAHWHSQDMQSVAAPVMPDAHMPVVSMTTLDQVLSGRGADIILIDIEGYEEPALRGAAQLLKDPTRRPRLVVIEVHPYNWHLCGGSSVSLQSFLHECGYAVVHLDGSPVGEIAHYGHVLAVPSSAALVHAYGDE